MQSPDSNNRKRLIAIMAMAVVAFVSVSATIPRYGVTWDEPTYIAQANGIRQWFGLLTVAPSKALSEDGISSHWPVWKGGQLPGEGNRSVQDRLNPPATALIGTILAALRKNPSDEFTDHRFIGAVSFAILVVLLFLWGEKLGGFETGILAAALFATMPRVFADAHFFATDLPAAAGMFAALFVLSSREISWKRAALGGVVLGFAFGLKFTAIVAPAILVVNAVVGKNFKAVPKLIAASAIGAIVFFAIYPGLWHDPISKLKFFLAVTAERSKILAIPTMYMGEVYRYNLPFSHPWVMVFGTIPAVTALLFFVGAALSVMKSEARADRSLHLVAFAMLMFSFMTPQAPGHDGARLFESAFPFVAIVAALGLVRLTAGLKSKRIANALRVAAALPGLVGIVAWFPHQTSYFGGLVGGARGARALGLETTYWGDVLDPKTESAIRNAVGPNATFADTVEPVSWRVTTGRFGSGASTKSDGADWTLLIGRQGMMDDATRLAFEYGAPEWELARHGVRLAALFKTAKMFDGVGAKLDAAKLPEGKALYLKGLMMEATGRPSEALALYDKSAATGSAPERVPIHRGRALVALGRPAEAVSIFLQIAQKAPSAEVYSELGRAYEASGDVARALDSYRRALSIELSYPGAAEAYSRLAAAPPL